jgi:hypothetical protein
MLYLLNTLIVPIDFDKYPSATIKVTRISVEEAKKLLSKNQFTSAIGHEATAKVLSQLLSIPIPVNRISVWMKEGDIGIHFFLKTRLPEGKVLSEEELKQLQFWLVKSEVLNDDDDEEEKKFIEVVEEIFGDC